MATIAMQGSITNAILALVKSGKAFNAELETLAPTMAAEVAAIEGVTAAQKVALLNEVYAAPLAQLKPQKDVMARLNALIFCHVAGSTQVEVAPPSKDGKVGAVFKTANTLTATEAKKHVADVRRLVKEAEETPTEKAARVKAEELSRMATQVVANKLAAEAANAKIEAAFAYVLSAPCHDELVERLAAQGYKVVKITTAPAKK